MKPHFHMAAALIMAAWSAGAPAQNREVEVLDIKDGFHLIRAIGNVTVFSGEDGMFLADSGDASFAPAIHEELRRISAKPVRYLVNSHWHYDHVGGNVLLGVSAVRLAHRRTAQLLRSDRRQFGQRIEPLPSGGLPNVTYDAGVTIELNGETIRVFHAPVSHTGGDTLVYFEKARILHTGDIFFLNRLPFVDLQSGGTVEGYTETVSRLLEWLPDDVVIVPGHGRLATVDDLRAYHVMLVKTSAAVLGRIREGDTLEEILATESAEPWRSWEWSNGFVDHPRWIRLIYQSHTGDIESVFEPEAR